MVSISLGVIYCFNRTVAEFCVHYWQCIFYLLLIIGVLLSTLPYLFLLLSTFPTCSIHFPSISFFSTKFSLSLSSAHYYPLSSALQFPLYLTSALHSPPNKGAAKKEFVLQHNNLSWGFFFSLSF